MTDAESRKQLQIQYDVIKQETNSWPDSLKLIPSYTELKIALRNYDRGNDL